MALAICHKSHMANEGEGETQRLSSSNSSTNEDNARVATHTHRQWQNKETNSAHFESFVVSFYVLFAVRVKCNKQTTNERKNEQSNDEQIDNMPPTPTPTLTPNAHAHMVQYKLLLCHISFFFLQFLCVFAARFFIFRFPHMIDCPLQISRAICFCIWQIHAHPQAANVCYAAAATRSAMPDRIWICICVSLYKCILQMQSVSKGWNTH